MISFFTLSVTSTPLLNATPKNLNHKGSPGLIPFCAKNLFNFCTSVCALKISLFANKFLVSVAYFTAIPGSIVTGKPFMV